MPRLWDISQPLRAELPVWPGDTPFEAVATWTHEATPVHVSRITLSTHSGAHADAPRHYDPAGATAEALDLARYLGPCRVVDARHATGAVRWHDVAAALRGERDLPRTGLERPIRADDLDFVFFTPDRDRRGLPLPTTDPPPRRPFSPAFPRAVERKRSGPGTFRRLARAPAFLEDAKCSADRRR